MSSDPNTASDCCNNCDDEIVTQVPGPPGDDGTDGTNGTDGINAFTVTNDDFEMPAADATGTLRVDDNAWAFVGQLINVANAGNHSSSSTQSGFLVVTDVSVVGQITVVNAAAYADLNLAPGDFVASGSAVAPAGPRGVTGTPGTATLNALSPTTTKGDLMVDNGGNAPAASVVRFGVGTSTHVLHADSTQPTGLNYKAIDLAGTATALTGALAITKGGTGQITRQLAVNALLDDTPAVGALEYYNGTNWVSLAKGTGLQVLRVNAGATGLEYATITGVGVLQVQQAGVSAATVITEVTPFDNTIPQVGEGKEILTATLTPISAASRVFIEVLVNISCDALDNVTLALFNGVANPDSIAATSTIAATVNAPRQISLLHEYSPGSVTPIAFSVRLGNATAGNNTTMNGVSGAAKLGGVQRSWIIVTEVG